MLRIEYLFIHCSDSLWGCAREIEQWHIQRGFKTIGYHFVIQNGFPTFPHIQNAHRVPALDGQIECGRYLDDDLVISDKEIGAHVTGYNERSIAVCLVGKTEFTSKQMSSLQRLLVDLVALYHIPVQNVLGHYEAKSGEDQGKTCPNMDMVKLRGQLAAWIQLDQQQIAQRRIP